jgi:hypothetical protein
MEIDELKQELERLDGKPPAPVEAPAPLRSGVFDAVLAAESRDQQERQKADAMNAKFKTCCDCYRVQPIIQAFCELCGIVPLMWLPATEYPENRELDGLRQMAAEFTVEQLKIALRAGWCSNRPERERVARNILAARIRQRDIQEVRDSVSAATAAYDEQNKRQPELPPKEKVRWLSAVYEQQSQEIQRQLAALQKMA